MAHSLSEASTSAEDVPAEEDGKPAFISGEWVSAEEVDQKKSSFEGGLSNAKERKSWIESFRQNRELDSNIWNRLHDNLVEKIIAKTSFRSFFRASLFSKIWRDKLRSDQLLKSEVQHNARVSWDSYSPLFVDGKKDLWGFETSSKHWHQLPSPRFYIPEYVFFDWELRAAAGSLLCWTSGPESHFHVTNPLTKSWKQLPPRPNMEYPKHVHMDWKAGSTAYWIVVPIGEGSLSLNVQIFDSSCDSWTTESYDTRTNFWEVFGGSAFINGVLYMFSYTLHRRHAVNRSPVHMFISFDVKEKIWKKIPLSYKFVDQDQKASQLYKRFYKIHLSRILVWQSNVILAIFHKSKMHNAQNNSQNRSHVILSLFKLDLECGLASEVCIPAEKMLRILHYPWESATLIFIDDCIYIRPYEALSPIVHYDVSIDEWHWVNYALDSPATFCGAPVPRCEAVIYQPGLNTFLEL